jgi:hypothetical protein
MKGFIHKNLDFKRVYIYIYIYIWWGWTLHLNVVQPLYIHERSTVRARTTSFERLRVMYCITSIRIATHLSMSF